MTTTHSRTFVRDGGEIEVAVEYTLTGGSPAVTWGPPESCDPGSPPEIEIQSVTCLASGSALTLTDSEASRFETEALENWDGDDGGPDPDDLRDSLVDDRLTGSDR